MSAMRMVIIGAGEAGARAAFALREAGHDGPVTLVGDEMVPPYERPPLSKAAFSEGWEPKFVATAQAYRQAGIELQLGAGVAGIDRQARRVSLSDGRALAYDRLLLATGAEPRKLAGLSGHPRVLTLRTERDARTLQPFLTEGRRIVIIGGGFIGLELAATARQKGADVTLIEAQPRILMRGVPALIAGRLHERHRAEGVTLHCGRGIEHVSASVDGVALRLAGGQAIEADLLVVGIGAIPRDGLARAAGLKVENGIAVDATLSTSDPAIFAAGDCCAFPLPGGNGRMVRLESWRNAQEHGALAARNMLGHGQPIATVPWFWSDQYDWSLQVAGLFDAAPARLVTRDEDGETPLVFQLDDKGRLTAAAGIGPGNSAARDIRLAEMLVAAQARPDPAELADPSVKLKSLLRKD